MKCDYRPARFELAPRNIRGVFQASRKYSRNLRKERIYKNWLKIKAGIITGTAALGMMRDNAKAFASFERQQQLIERRA